MCPVEAIFYEDDLPEEWEDYHAANVDFFDDIGSPGGADAHGVINKDHPFIAGLPPQNTDDSTRISMTTTPFRVAVIGAGPAGIYAADLLTKADHDLDLSIDLFERLPSPFGLVRYGVAPDHPRIKGIINALIKVLDRGDIRLFGNVEYGVDISLGELTDRYDAVIFSTGCFTDAPLALPGVDLPGSYGAADFVNWYDSHPDVAQTWPLEAEKVAVIGNGNVALDVARVLAKQADDLHTTEIPDHVYEGLKASQVTDVHVFGRRGPLRRSSRRSSCVSSVRSKTSTSSSTPKTSNSIRDRSTRSSRATRSSRSRRRSRTSRCGSRRARSVASTSTSSTHRRPSSARNG